MANNSLYEVQQRKQWQANPEIAVEQLTVRINSRHILRYARTGDIFKIDLAKYRATSVGRVEETDINEQATDYLLLELERGWPINTPGDTVPGRDDEIDFDLSAFREPLSWYSGSIAKVFAPILWGGTRVTENWWIVFEQRTMYTPNREVFISLDEIPSSVDRVWIAGRLVFDRLSNLTQSDSFIRPNPLGSSRSKLPLEPPKKREKDAEQSTGLTETYNRSLIERVRRPILEDD